MTSVVSIPVLTFLLAAAVTAAVVVEDILHRRIPNVACAVLLLIGSLSAGLGGGWRGLAEGLLGAAVGFVVFLIPYGIGGLGGGDVKLMAALGSLTGVRGVIPALVLVAIIGAATAIVCLLWTRLRGKGTPVAIPYAPAIALGSLLVAFSQIGAN